MEASDRIQIIIHQVVNKREEYENSEPIAIELVGVFEETEEIPAR